MYASSMTVPLTALAVSRMPLIRGRFGKALPRATRARELAGKRLDLSIRDARSPHPDIRRGDDKPPTFGFLEVEPEAGPGPEPVTVQNLEKLAPRVDHLVREINFHHRFLSQARIPYRLAVQAEYRTRASCTVTSGLYRAVSLQSFTSFLSGISCCRKRRAIQAFRAHSTAYPAR